MHVSDTFQIMSKDVLFDIFEHAGKLFRKNENTFVSWQVNPISAEVIAEGDTFAGVARIHLDILRGRSLTRGQYLEAGIQLVAQDQPKWRHKTKVSTIPPAGLVGATRKFNTQQLVFGQQIYLTSASAETCIEDADARELLRTIHNIRRPHDARFSILRPFTEEKTDADDITKPLHDLTIFF
jgi:hypothetical protein